LNSLIFSIISIVFVFVLFFGFEFALFQENLSNQESEKIDKRFGIRIIRMILINERVYVSSVILGRMVSITFLAYLAFYIFDLKTGNLANVFFYSFFLILVLSVLIVMLGYFIPKILFKIGKDKTFDVFAILLLIIYIPSFLFAKFILDVSRIVSFFFISKKHVENAVFKLHFKSVTDESRSVKSSDNSLELETEHDVKIFQNALEFSKTRLRDCSIPRNEIEAIELNSSIEKLKERFIETGYSKILVYHDTIDNIIGYAQSIDIFRSPQSIESILKSLVIVPETMPANKLMNLFLKEHKSIALVVDEFGGTYGLATLEDIMEEIFGEIEDEHDSTHYREERISDNEFVLSGRLEIDYINEKFALDLPELDEYATIAGFILYYNEKVPKENDKIRLGNYELDILKMHYPKIELVKLKRI
jgi:CBS domain containing-hemolysin-like protein